MAIKVIGAGFGRTGTLSLKVALETLGFGKCYHMVELLAHPEHITTWERAARGEQPDWHALFQGYQAIVDFPGYRFYRELMHIYPEAKVLLTVRDPEQWYESTYQTIYQVGPSLLQRILLSFQLPFSPRLRRLIRVFQYSDRMVWKKDFQGRFTDKSFAIELYHRHIDNVKSTVPPERLLIYSVTEGWEPLCRFLGVAVPEQLAFPRLNERAAFQQHARQVIGGRARKH